MSMHVFGIRHHGPGCAHHLRAALTELQPDIVLVEGPPDAQDVLPLITKADMQPPVALLVYAPDHPSQAVYYPFTFFSPEWQALNYALASGIPARFMDLPQALQMENKEADETADPASASGEVAVIQEQDSDGAKQEAEVDPLTLLAQAAGYADQELWWESMVERRQNSVDLFEGILEAMSALREGGSPRNEREAQREAYMRQTIRAAQKEGFQRIAIVCGAWHAPVLINPTESGVARADSALLKGLKRCKTTATWIPWTNSRLAYRSGYGAGVESPGWYAHLWTTKEDVTARWITRAAHLLRQEGLQASSASVIEAVRLSEALAALRDQSLPGLAEHTEAILTVLCNGESTPMQLIRTRLEIGTEMGKVPEETPTVPLLRDLEEQRRRLRLEQNEEKSSLELDLRKENDLARSHLLHRLRLLAVPWGTPMAVRGQRGTFNEHWTLQWQVEFVVQLIEANIYGSTIAAATANFVRSRAQQLEDLPELTQLLDNTILAELPDAIESVLQAIQQRSALTSDIQHLMDALPALARIARYSNVRQTRAEHILPIIDSLFERSIIGLPNACCALDYAAAQSMLNSINHMQESVQLLDRGDLREHWHQALYSLAEQENMHGLIRGRACHILLEHNVLSEEELQRMATISLSPAGDTEQAAAWVEGFLPGNALLILHQDQLWRILDRWLKGLEAEAFIALLPILRRAFARFQQPERRKMGEKVRHLYNQSSRKNTDGHKEINSEQAELVLPVLAQLLGVTYGQ